MRYDPLKLTESEREVYINNRLLIYLTVISSAKSRFVD